MSGFTTVPLSCTAQYLRTFTKPVSGSTSAMHATAWFGHDGYELKRPCVSGWW
jgi:hypothetical protein